MDKNDPKYKAFSAAVEEILKEKGPALVESSLKELVAKHKKENPGDVNLFDELFG